MANSLLRNFHNPNTETLLKGKGVYLYTKKNKYLDTTSGLTGTSILGWSNPSVSRAINSQLKKIGHIDYKYFYDENRENLARLLLSKNENKLDKVFFVGGSGGEACEAAMKMSYQYHKAVGKPKKRWFISRDQSYHGSGSDSISLGDRPNLKFYEPFFPKFRAKVPEHNVYRKRRKNETILEYENRSIKELTDKIKKIGAENISGFVAETIMGGLVGDVPPTKNYWKKIRRVCDKNKIHLILDEVWCGTGTSGKIYCIDWDGITPDFLFLGKTLGAGYAPVSAFLTKKSISDKILKKEKSIQFSTTHQGHSIGVAASLAVQKIIHKTTFLTKVNNNGNYFRKTLEQELASNEFFKNVRGRGLRNSLEYHCPENHLFGLALTDFAKKNHGMLISAKWHRVCFSVAINVRKKELDLILEKFIDTFNNISKKWNYKLRSKYKKLRKHRNFF